MKNNDIIQFIKTKISREFNLEGKLEGISIHIVGSLAIRIRLGQSLENYFNGESDIDCIVVILENGIITQNSEMFERKVQDTFLNNQVDVINYSIVYGKKRNSINIKFIKKENLYKLTDIREVNFKSLRKDSLVRHKPVTKFYGEENEIEFEYLEKQAGELYLIEYHFFTFTNNIFFLCDIHSMLLFSLNISNTNYKDLPEILFFKMELYSILKKKDDLYYFSMFKNFHHIVKSPEELSKLIPKLSIFLIDQKESMDLLTYFEIRKLTRESILEPIIIICGARESHDYIKTDFLNFKIYAALEILENFSWIKTIQDSKIYLEANENDNLYSVIELFSLFEKFSNKLNNIFASKKICSDKNMSRFEDYYDKKLFFPMDNKLSSSLIFLGGLEDCFYKLVKLKDTELVKMSDEFFSEKTTKIENIIQKYNIIVKLVSFLCNEDTSNTSKSLKNFFEELTNTKAKMSKNMKIITASSDTTSLIDVLFLSGDFKSKNELHRLFIQNSVKSLSGEILKQGCIDFKGEVIKIGKRRYYKIE